MLNKLKNKYESQKISKKFKNKHRKNRVNPKSFIRRKWTKEAYNWCKKCQIKNCKYGTKKELRRLKKIHFKDCDCKLTFKQYEEMNEYKKYPNIIIDEKEVFDALRGGTPDSSFHDSCSCCYRYRSPTPCSTFVKYKKNDIDDDDECDFEEEYHWKRLECKHKKNKYLSQKIAKKFKNKHKDHKYKKYITRRQRKRMYSSTVDTKQHYEHEINQINLKKTKFKAFKNKHKHQKYKKYMILYNIKKDIYDYQRLYDELDNIQQFNYSDDMDQQYENENISNYNAKQKSMKYDSFPSKSSSKNSTPYIYNNLLPLKYIINNTPYYNSFGGYVKHKHKNGGFIIFDDIDIKAKYWWKKTIYFNKKDCDIKYDNLYENKRVLFNIKIKYLSGRMEGCKWRAIKIRRTKPIEFISNNNAELLLFGYFSIYLNRNDKCLPMDVEQMIIRYSIEQRYDVNINHIPDYKTKQKNVIKYEKFNHTKPSYHIEKINHNEQKVIKYDKLSSELSSYSLIWIDNKWSPDSPLKQCIYYDVFAGYIENKVENGGIIIFDDINMNAKYWWKKNIYFGKKDCDISYDNLCKNERVLFNIKVDKIFKNGILYYYKLKAINIKYAKPIGFISNIHADLLIYGYFSTYFNQNNKHLPIDIEVIILCYYIQHNEDQWRYKICNQEYCIKDNYIVHHKNTALSHNIIISKIGLKRSMNEIHHFFFKVFKKPISGYFGVGVMSHPQKVIDYLCKYNNKRPWYINYLNKFSKKRYSDKYKWHYKAPDFFFLVDNDIKKQLYINNEDLFCLDINFDGLIGSMILYKNCDRIQVRHFDSESDDLYFPFIAFGNGTPTKDNSIQVKLYKNASHCSQ